MNMTDIMNNPLARPGDPGQFLRLVLAQAGGYGMPGAVIAMLDDIAAMLGFYTPLPTGPAGHLAGPLVTWRSHPKQPTQDHIVEMFSLAYQQRALIAFGGAPPDHMVGTAEIVTAMGNTTREQTPAEYYEVFQWASVDALSALLNQTPAEVLADPGKKDWKRIEDAEVIRPGGRLYATYVEIATAIRRTAIEALKADENHPRKLMLPLARSVVAAYNKTRARSLAEGQPELVAIFDKNLATIHEMFPELDKDPAGIPQNVEQAPA